MKKLFILFAAIWSAAVCVNTYGQQTPAGAGDRDLRDTNIRSRSVELERIDREARERGEPASGTTLPVNYAEIKADYEQIQLSEDAVVKAYKNSTGIAYAEIGKAAAEINKRAKRLHANLFASPVESSRSKGEKSGKPETEPKPAARVRDLIVALDNAIGRFATSPMFQNLRTVETAISEKAKQDLSAIVKLSAELSAQARKAAEN